MYTFYFEEMENMVLCVLRPVTVQLGECVLVCVCVCVCSLLPGNQGNI